MRKDWVCCLSDLKGRQQTNKGQASVPLRGTGTVAARADAATADARRARRAYQVRACRTTLA